MRTVLSSLIVLICLAAALAQVTVEQEVTTDSVNLFQQVDEQEVGKSSTVALLAGLLVPGAGHYYMGQERPALAYFTVDALAIFGIAFSEYYSRKVAGDAANYAWLYAGVQGSHRADDRYWQAVGSFMDSEGYNRVMDLNRTPGDKYTAENLQWSWADKRYQDKYNSIRGISRKFHVASTFFAGALVLDRIVAFVDMRGNFRNKYLQQQSSLRIAPSVAPDLSNLALTLHANF